MSLQNSRQISDVKVLLKMGADGASIVNIEKTGTSGLVDTYTITLSNGQKYTFDVTNGNGIKNITKTGTSGLVDTYTITFDDDTTTTYEVTNGEGSSAASLPYDNTQSGLQATNVQAAIDEIVTESKNDILYFTGIACSALTGNFATISDSAITANHVVSECIFANSQAPKSDVTWTTSNGSLTLNGSCTVATTVNIVLVKKNN